jgi:hypothetical protein
LGGSATPERSGLDQPGSGTALRRRTTVIRRLTPSALAEHPSRAVFVGVLLVSLALLPASNYSTDGNSMLAVSRSLAFHHSFAVPCSVGHPGTGGRCYSTWYPLLSLVMVPFVLVGHALASLAGVRVTAGEEMLALIVPALATAGAAALTTGLAREMGASIRASVLAACAFAFGTEELCYTRTLFAETLGAFCVALTVWGFAGDARRRRLVGMPAIGLALLAKPQLVLVGPLVGLGIAVGRRSLVPLLEALIANLIGGVIFLLYNLLRFGSLTDFGGTTRTVIPSAGHGGGPSLLERIGLLTVSPRQGLFLFSPVVAVGVVLLWRHRRQPVVLACAGGALGVFAFYLLLPYGNNWATRYLVPALPLLCAPLALAKRKTARVAITLALLGLVIELPTTVAYYERYYREAGNKSFQLWSVSNSQLWRIWPAAYHELRSAFRSNVVHLVSAADGNKRRNRLINTVALWFWVLPVAGIPWEAGLVVALVVMAAGISVLVRAARGPPAPLGAARQMA